MLDERNNLWRWRSVDTKGKGTLVRTRIADSASWGNDVDVMATFVANFDAAFYKLYIVDPSEQNIMVLSPANDGSGYPRQADRPAADRPARRRHHRPAARRRHLRRRGRRRGARDPGLGWDIDPPEDTQVRPDPRYTILVVARPARRLVRASGSVRCTRSTRRTTGSSPSTRATATTSPSTSSRTAAPSWSELRDMVVLPGADDESPATAWWISGNALHSAVLKQAEGPAPTSSPTPTEEPTPDPTEEAAQDARP